jgi:hypothetical protein
VCPCVPTKPRDVAVDTCCQVRSELTLIAPPSTSPFFSLFPLACHSPSFYLPRHQIVAQVKTRPSPHQPTMRGSPKSVNRLIASRRLQPHKARAAQVPSPLSKHLCSFKDRLPHRPHPYALALNVATIQFSSWIIAVIIETPHGLLPAAWTIRPSHSLFSSPPVVYLSCLRIINNHLLASPREGINQSIRQSFGPISDLAPACLRLRLRLSRLSNRPPTSVLEFLVPILSFTRSDSRCSPSTSRSVIALSAPRICLSRSFTNA